MALHRSTTKAASTLVRLKSKKAQLELKANQLAARKTDVEAKANQLSKSLQRTIDTREKIVLGALMKMVFLDRFTLEQPNVNQTKATGDHNGNVIASNRERHDNALAKYDLDLLVGALLSLSEQLDNDTAMLGELRKRGAEFRSQSKIDRLVKLRSS